MRAIRLIVFCMILSNCASFPQKPAGSCKDTCDAVIEAQEARYQVCQSHVQECTAALKKANPTIFSRLVTGLVGLGLGLAIGVRLSR